MECHQYHGTVSCYSQVGAGLKTYKLLVVEFQMAILGVLFVAETTI